ncbi:sulfatase family protein [Conexibacter arvalis]|uniref:Arylsulfatase A-like enzyme n=1 Tax=Conexibacter arvalis TaxID=912552 RepID=A0A840ILE9_9ACTN|nr:sulfatase [Conexibacter arvalis]MBB4665165.1 arylsulfatase A-like enzyme [Conexibacter arvalis]
MAHAIDRRTLLRAGAGAAGAAVLTARSVPQALAAGRAARPNVLLLVIDSLRADHLGCHGADVATPNIDALARESVRLRHAHSEALPTGPARRSILTGRRIFPFHGWAPPKGLNQGPGWLPIGAREQTLFSALRRAGYWTGYVSDNPFLAFNTTFAGFRGSFDRFQRVGGQIGSLRPVSSVSRRELERWLPDWMQQPKYRTSIRRYLADNGRGRDERQTAAARVCLQGIDVLEQAARQRKPFALGIDCFDPHEPWVPPPRYLNRYLDRAHRGPVPADLRYGRADYLDAAGLAAMRAVYCAMVTLVDHWIGNVLQRLVELRLADETAVVLVSDHGLLLGEHGLTGKLATELHPEMTHVPLLVRAPDGRGGGRASDFFGSTHDIAPTLLSLAGVRRPRGMDGFDLSPLLRGRSPGRRLVAFGGYANSYYVRDRSWCLLGRNDGSRRRLFDLRADPGETRDVAAAHPEVVTRMHRRVVQATGGRPLPFYGDYLKRKRQIRERAQQRRAR